MAEKFCIRNYCSPDFNRFLKFYMACADDESASWEILFRQLSENLNHPECFPDENIFLAIQEKTIVGACRLTPELKIGRLLLDIAVHPAFRRRKIASGLLAKALERGRELGVYMLHANVAAANRAAKRFLKQMGFKTVRRYYELFLNLRDLNLEACNPHPFSISCLKPGQEHRMTMMQNYFFKGSWGFNPNTVAAVSHEIGMYGGSHEDIILVFDGEQPVGYCWTRTDRDANAIRREKTGRIHMIGVNPKYRGGGLGKITLMAGLCRLKDQGAQIAELTTDSRNTAARKLYESIGFKHRQTLLWYEKAV